MKKCKNCGIIGEFYKSNQSRCKECCKKDSLLRHHIKNGRKYIKNGKNKELIPYDFLDAHFKKGYRERISEWFNNEVLTELNNLWLKRK